ncbi:precorrin-6y C5,15-methyltransferase (decarboxylating) subunit CbiE [Chitinophaga sp. G-6-1-13]|uniref:Precorrin-6y C5,15-methyltransferase (Decarboxylating) subunit CbiE n=1 Tax=Chitinophaga fulva TaxID=2728842 RepID=A0A848GTG2_9BACT|nr:precorrin-6y C5,15-methyltransferase (decarboxylating) subunit CbiE [Chitinophaga fulva]NML40412.1 precorrin-6y C5,15-methyltransferase (decarboxylating) subunit CbiE [Chitinophaga fulva]
MHFIVIGTANQTTHNIMPEALPLLAQPCVFSGGQRHYGLVKALLPEQHTWITIKGSMVALFEQYQQAGETVVIFASGDPLFYGMVQTIYKYAPKATLQVFPHFSSIQRLFTKIGQPYEQVRHTSVHGRGWKELDAALIKDDKFISVLTDVTRSPQAIAARMLQYNFHHYEMVVAEDLDGQQENITSGTLKEMTTRSFHPLNCVLLRQVSPAKMPGMGIADQQFEGLPGRPNMITKRSVRLVTLSHLQLHTAATFWDIGCCTGSVAIEAKRMHADLGVYAFEIRTECETIIQHNMERLAAPGIEVVMGDFYEKDHASLPSPDAVFIGGHGNRLDALVQIINQHINKGGRIVLNAVQASSREQFVISATNAGWELQPEEVLQVNAHNPITILTAIKTR